MLNQQVASETSITAIQRSTVGKLLIPELLCSPLFVGTNCAADPHPGKNSLVTTVLPPTSQQKACTLQYQSTQQTQGLSETTRSKPPQETLLHPSECKALLHVTTCYHYQGVARCDSTLSVAVLRASLGCFEYFWLPHNSDVSRL